MVDLPPRKGWISIDFRGARTESVPVFRPAPLVDERGMGRPTFVYGPHMNLLFMPYERRLWYYCYYCRLLSAVETVQCYVELFLRNPPFIFLPYRES